MTDQPKVLIVDDEAPLVRMLAAHLTEMGYRVVSASDGVEAMRVVKEESPDVVLCDIVMPDIDGIEVLRQVKQTYPRLPVIMMTGYAERDNLDACIVAGAEDYLSKPFNHDTLRDVLSRAVQKAERLKFLFEQDKKKDVPPPSNPLEGNW